MRCQIFANSADLWVPVRVPDDKQARIHWNKGMCGSFFLKRVQVVYREVITETWVLSYIPFPCISYKPISIYFVSSPGLGLLESRIFSLSSHRTIARL